jgi:regulator of protease activity HflC (stomatin/prohibitin superfamily)
MKWLAWALGNCLFLMLALALFVLLRPTETRQAIDARQTRERDAEQKRQNAEMEEFKRRQPSTSARRYPVVTKADYDAVARGMSHARVSEMIRYPARN